MYLRLRLRDRMRSQVDAISWRTRLPRWRQFRPLSVWRDPYLVDTLALIALALALFAFALWLGSHPVE